MVAQQKQYSLRTLMMATISIGICCGIAGKQIRDVHVERTNRNAAVQQITERGGSVQESMVTLAGTDAKDGDLSVLRHLQIRDLNLGATSVSNAGLRYIPASVVHLNLSGTAVDDRGIPRLGACQSLETLKLRMTAVTGATLPIPALQRLSYLDLSLCSISDEGIRTIASRPLSFLSLAESNIDDGYLPALKTLVVDTLDLTDTHLSSTAFASLQAAHPTMKIIR